ncbi:Stress responsive A/B Barrel Domain [Pseudobutyrivibrio sp. ACV-2]|uniref:Dabb family protein n=1 Tax=Pseudobutyrivibrio sp. ACV-2 TaxID=1520801 RepID=UPI00089CC84D|nr:Dabb family protein [Pseudobutyrivibrio sp. ACV-2]SEA82678.1 Stress responsive A/B Barrel Domain [Pseudobutyrivibrio sp. ACV-2]
MVKQVTIWKLQDKCFGPNLGEIKGNIKSNFEQLKGKVPGLEHIEVTVDCMSSSNGDVIMTAEFEDEISLKQRQSNEYWGAALKQTVVPFVDETTHVEFVV